jgi:hypothetical protein
VKKNIHMLIKRWKAKRRERYILKMCGCIAYCPQCNEPLNDQALWFDANNDGHGYYQCSVCNKISEWHFGIAPVPFLLASKDNLEIEEILYEKDLL